MSHQPEDRQDSSEGPSGNTRRGRRIPRSAVVKFLVMIAVLVIAALTLRYTPLSEFLTREKMVATLDQLRLAWWSPLALIGLYVVLSPTGLPVSPLIFAGGVVFGVKWGWLYNFIGSLLGATSSYLLARALGRQLIEHVAGEALITKVEQILEPGARPLSSNTIRGDQLRSSPGGNSMASLHNHLSNWLGALHGDLDLLRVRHL